MKAGQKMGCSDGGRPEVATDAQLSRMRDALDALRAAGLHEAHKAAWDAVPPAVKMDYGWSSWTYVPGVPPEA